MRYHALMSEPSTSYDQTKPCPRCQQKAPALRFTQLETCIFCGYPRPASTRTPGQA